MSTTRSWAHYDAGLITQQAGVSWTSTIDGQVFRYRGAEARMIALQACADHVETLLTDQDDDDGDAE